MTTGLSPETFENLQLNSGAFLKNLNYSTVAGTAEMKSLISTALNNRTGVIGATRGGGRFNCVPRTRLMEADGMRDPVVGSLQIDGWDINMSGTLLEITPQNFKDALGAADFEENGKLTTIKLRNTIKKTDHIDSLLWVGDTSAGYLLIDLKNALNTSGITFTFTDRNENTLPFRFQAFIKDWEDMDKPPVNIVFIK